MRQELQNKLFEKYPLIFQDRNKPKTETCMCWGIETPDEWYPVLDSLCRALQWNTDKNNYPQVIADQVKEKFGGLRFYCHLAHPDNYDDKKADYQEGVIDGLIRMAEYWVMHIEESLEVEDE